MIEFRPPPRYRRLFAALGAVYLASVLLSAFVGDELQRLIFFAWLIASAIVAGIFFVSDENYYRRLLRFLFGIIAKDEKRK